MLSGLKDMPHPPSCLNLLGKILPQDSVNLVVIGTRRMTVYGKNVIKSLVPELATNHITLISGMAPGCDSYAQEVVLECGGRTVGVLGYGLNFMRNDSNYKVINKVIKSENGLVISPFSRFQKPSKDSFIYRNQFMAALGKGVLVIEAGRKSGVFHTVNAALELGKEVFAVPGDIFRLQCQGTNNLLREGAQMVLSTDDFLTKIK